MILPAYAKKRSFADALGVLDKLRTRRGLYSRLLKEHCALPEFLRN